MSRYEHVATYLRSMIQSGQLAPGAKLPSTAELKRQFDVSYGTVRSAMLVLKAENPFSRGSKLWLRARRPLTQLLRCAGRRRG